jgi:hypothetical protein
MLTLIARTQEVELSLAMWVELVWCFVGMAK